MAQNETLIIRAALATKASIYRDIEIEASKSLYQFANAITSAFDFDFDHAFGFYTGLTPNKMETLPKYELFTDLGEPTPGALGVKKVKIATAFANIGHTMMFVFDYGDEWLFLVRLMSTGQKVAKTRYPRVIAKHGEAPEQYPDPDDSDLD
jgi:hypothetical protein